jgi:muconolactone delta-isomerase
MTSEMHYLVKGEFIEEMLAGKTPEEAAMFSEQVIKPSLEALWKLSEEKKVFGGVTAGARESAFIIDVESNAELGRLLRSLPFWGAMRWTVSPLQSFQSAADQDSEAVQAMRAMVVGS